MTVKQIAQTAGKAYLKKKGSEYAVDATRSICYQSIVENRINLVTVAMDTFIHPYVGEFVGNAFFVGVKFGNGTPEFAANSILNEGLTAKEFSALIVKSTIKACLNGKFNLDKKASKVFGMMGGVPYDVFLHSFVVSVGTQIEK